MSRVLRTYFAINRCAFCNFITSHPSRQLSHRWSVQPTAEVHRAASRSIAASRRTFMQTWGRHKEVRRVCVSDSAHERCKSRDRCHRMVLDWLAIFAKDMGGRYQFSTLICNVLPPLFFCCFSHLSPQLSHSFGASAGSSGGFGRKTRPTVEGKCDIWGRFGSIRSRARTNPWETAVLVLTLGFPELHVGRRVPVASAPPAHAQTCRNMLYVAKELYPKTKSDWTVHIRQLTACALSLRYRSRNRGRQRGPEK